MHIQNISVVFGPTLIKTPPSLEQNVFLAVKEMQHQIKAVECLITNFEYFFGSRIVLKSTDTVFDQSLASSDSKLLKTYSIPHIQPTDINNYKTKSQSFHDFDREPIPIKSKEEMIQLKKNRRKQHIITGSLPIHSELMEVEPGKRKGNEKDSNSNEPSNDTINYMNESILF